MNGLGLEDRVEHIAGILVDMLEQCPGMTLCDAEEMNRAGGWTYTLPTYQAYPLTGREEPFIVEGDILDSISLRKAWDLAVAVRDDLG